MLAAGLGLCVLGYAQSLLARPAELLAVEKWQLSYTYNAQGSGKTGGGEWFYHESASGNALLVRRRAAMPATKRRKQCRKMTPTRKR